MTEFYCGPAPAPETLMLAWRVDPVALLLCAGLVTAWAFRGRSGHRLAAGGAVTLTALLFLSPLCALTVALFSARAVHHLLLIAAVAPLLALAFPAGARRSAVGVGWVAAIHAAVFWLWHAPPVYGTAIAHPVAYWAMQASLLGTGFWLWRRVFDTREGMAGVLFALFGTTVQMGMLGAILTFAPAPLYAPHALTTMPFGLSPVQDQQLAGIVMWVPAALPYLAAAVLRAWPLTARPEGGERWSG